MAVGAENGCLGATAARKPLTGIYAVHCLLTLAVVIFRNYYYGHDEAVGYLLLFAISCYIFVGIRLKRDGPLYFGSFTHMVALFVEFWEMYATLRNGTPFKGEKYEGDNTVLWPFHLFYCFWNFWMYTLVSEQYAMLRQERTEKGKYSKTKRFWSVMTLAVPRAGAKILLLLVHALLVAAMLTRLIMEWTDTTNYRTVMDDDMITYDAMVVIFFHIIGLMALLTIFGGLIGNNFWILRIGAVYHGLYSIYALTTMILAIRESNQTHRWKVTTEGIIEFVATIWMMRLLSMYSGSNKEFLKNKPVAEDAEKNPDGIPKESQALLSKIEES